ncbi:probable magnesium transporter NIPA4 [Olea europaea subsp. europaea]|uniref:Probable magnesium transporter n=1 Tax=Olea europaea subsp. europaea TaxID=158383 RepID=A0A8S0Q1N5_OLEEU|nr:probable magnesium transporter NIPA4 [Olea europaea subsp. europaea]
MPILEVAAAATAASAATNFIVKKKGLKKAGASGLRAGAGGYSYLYELLWLVGMITMIVGEIANFAAYAFATAILVTPLGALSSIIRRYTFFGVLGCELCVMGSTTIVLHAPQDREIDSVKEVMSVKALGIALKLTLSGMNQLIYPETWGFDLVVIVCVLTQKNYLNEVKNEFSLLVLFFSSVDLLCPYFVMFTSLTILASVIVFKDWDRQNPTQIVTEMCGFMTTLSGTFLLHKTKDIAEGSMSTTPWLPKHANEDDNFVHEGIH